MNIKNIMIFDADEDNYLPNDPRVPSDVCPDCGRTDCDQIEYPCEACGFPHCDSDTTCIDYTHEEECDDLDSDSFDDDVDSWDDLNGNFVKKWADIDKDPPGANAPSRGAQATPNPDPAGNVSHSSDPDDDDDSDVLTPQPLTPIVDADDEDTDPNISMDPISWDDLDTEPKKTEEMPTEGKMLSDLEALIAKNKKKLPGEPCERCGKPCQHCGETYCGPCEVELEKQ